MNLKSNRDSDPDDMAVTADDPSKPTKGEMAKGIRLLIANARDDEELFNDLGRHW